MVEERVIFLDDLLQLPEDAETISDEHHGCEIKPGDQAYHGELFVSRVAAPGLPRDKHRYIIVGVFDTMTSEERRRDRYKRGARRFFAVTKIAPDYDRIKEARLGISVPNKLGFATFAGDELPLASGAESTFYDEFVLFREDNISKSLPLADLLNVFQRNFRPSSKYWSPDNRTLAWNPNEDGDDGGVYALRC